MSTVLGSGYRDFLANKHEGASSNADLVAHFFRLAFDGVRDKGTIGFVATNTIAEGDTRVSGLGFIKTHGGNIYAATRRARWSGAASVVVSIVHVRRGPMPKCGATLDEKNVASINAFLSHVGGDTDPHRLDENRGRSFIGCFLRGMGFTFDDASPAATPLAEADKLAARGPLYRARIRPYLGGEELNASPGQAATRKVIVFHGLTLAEAGKTPALLDIVRNKVKPERDRLGSSPVDRGHKEKWWRYANDRPELAEATRGLERILVTARVSRTLAFAFIPSDVVPSDQLVVFAFDGHAAFAVLSSRVHALFARRLASSFGDGLRYTPSDCFETFPFPRAFERDVALGRIGRRYERTRAKLLVETGEGLTAFYGRFHDPRVTDSRIAAIRALHDEMDRAVLAAYGWSDLAIERDAGGIAWSEATNDGVFARLLAENEARAQRRACRDGPRPGVPRGTRAGDERSTAFLVRIGVRREVGLFTGGRRQ